MRTVSRWLRLAPTLLALLGGCGSGGDQVISSPESAVVAPVAGAGTLSGIVRSEQGTPQPGVLLVAMERVTDFKAEVMTGSDGSFTLDLPAGTYDVGLDRADDPSTATCYYGPVEVTTSRRDFVLHSSAGRPAAALFGRIFLHSDQPARGRRVRLRPTVGLSDATEQYLPEPVQTVTDEQGRFDLVFDTMFAMNLDVELHDGTGRLDEHVDVIKRGGKASYVEFTSEDSAVENRLPSGEVAEADSSELVLSRELAARFYTRFTKTEKVFETEFVRTTLDAGGLPSGVFGPVFKGLRFSQGRLQAQLNPPLVRSRLEEVIDVNDPLFLNPHESTRHFLIGELTQAFHDLFLSYGPFRPEIYVAKNGSWWYRYAVNVKVYRPGGWKFTDETSDTYVLNVISSLISNTHQVSYNSDKPDIVQLQALPIRPVGE